MKVEIHNHSMIPSSLMRQEILQKFMAFDPGSDNAMKHSYQAVLEASTVNRESLSKSLLAYNKLIQNDELSKLNCLDLKNPNSTVIITGQQAGMCTGPLYTIYKIITTLNLAKFYGKYFHSPVVPIFWNATEDHDLSEIASFHYPGRQWRVPFQNKGVAAEALRTHPECTQLIHDFLATISPSNHREEIEKILGNPCDDYGLYSSRIIANLFKGTGLVLLEPRILREMSSEFFKDCVRHKQEVRERLQTTGKALVENGVSPSFEARPGSTGLFYINESGNRARIQEKRDEFAIHNKLVSEEELLELIDSQTNRFSTGAYLRPVLQSLKIPTIAYVAGPSEFNYYLQLLPIYQQFKALMPVILPRNHATVLTQKELKLASTLNLNVEEYFSPRNHSYNLSDLPQKYSDSFEKAKNELEDMTVALYGSLSHLVSKEYMNTFTNRVNFQLQKLEKKCLKEHLRAQSSDHSRLSRFYNTVHPKNSGQERVLNVFYFIEKNGLGFIQDLIDVLDPFEKGHYILYTDQ